MNKGNHSVQLFDELQILLAVRKKLSVKAEIDRIVADTAEKFIATLNAEIDDETKKVSAPPASTKKSEMPCNCKQETTLPEFAAKTASCVFEVPKYKEVVPAILVPLQEALDETKAQSTDKQNYVYMVFRVGETGAR